MSDERFDIDVGFHDPDDPGTYEEAEMEAREARQRDREDAAGEACDRHYPNPSASCPACGAP